MIDPIFFGLGFFAYMGFCLVTFDVYSNKKSPMTPYVLLFIYLYYTLLAAYLINIIDVNGTFMEKVVEFMMYFLAGGILCLYYYRNVIESSYERPTYKYRL